MSNIKEEDKTQEEDKEVAVEKKEVIYSETEVSAMEQGWVPKKDWVDQGGDPDEWRTAKEFNDRTSLYKTIHSTRRDLKQTQSALTALQKHHQFVFENAYQKAMTDLKREKRAAIRSEDFEKLEQVEDEMEQLQEQHQQEKQEIQQQQAQVNQSQAPHPDFVEWQNHNMWYDNDPDLREFADAKGLIYINKNPGVTPAQVLTHVENAVKKHFPTKFGTRKAAPNAVVGVDRSSKSGTTQMNDDIELDEMERSIMKTFVDSNVMTEKEYKAELKKVKGLVK